MSNSLGNIFSLLSADYKDKLRVRIVMNTEVLPRGCWQWLKCVNADGYGQIGITEGKVRAVVSVHRLVFFLAKNSVAFGKCVCHHCDNPGCANPDHLFVGTQVQNIADMVAKKRNRHNGKDIIIDGVTYESRRAAARVLGTVHSVIGDRILSDKYPNYEAT